MAKPFFLLSTVDGIHQKSPKFSTELGLSIEDTRVVGHGCSYVGTFLPGHCTGRTGIWYVYIGGDTPHWEGNGGFPQLDGTKYHGEATKSISL